MTNLTCKVYGNVSKMSDRGLEHAWNSNVVRMRWSPENSAFKALYTKADYIEAMACLILESEYRWENGGRAKRQAQLDAQFGDQAVQLK